MYEFKLLMNDFHHSSPLEYMEWGVLTYNQNPNLLLFVSLLGMNLFFVNQWVEIIPELVEIVHKPVDLIMHEHTMIGF
jgi:hypothetical protein